VDDGRGSRSLAKSRNRRVFCQWVGQLGDYSRTVDTTFIGDKGCVEDVTARLALCHTIRIRALNIYIRLVHDDDSATWWTSLDAPCDRCSKKALHRVPLDRCSKCGQAFLNRLQSRTFSGLLLGHTNKLDQYLAEPYWPEVMVFDWQDEEQTIAERLEFFCIRSSLVRFDHACCRSFDLCSIPTLEREVILR